MFIRDRKKYKNYEYHGFLEKEIYQNIFQSVLDDIKFRKLDLGDDFLSYKINKVLRENFTYKIKDINNINNKDIIDKFIEFSNRYLKTYEFIAIEKDNAMIIENNNEFIFYLKLYICKEETE